MSSSTQLRLLTMLKLIPPYPASISAKTLRERLVAEGFTACLRTVQRDLRRMEFLMGLESEKSAEGGRWRFARENTELLPNMRPSEALLLVIAEQMLRQLLPGESLSMLEPRLNKAKKTLEQHSAKGQLGSWQSKLRVITGELPFIQIISEEQEDIRLCVYDAILKETRIKICYQKTPHREKKEYLLNPQGLIVRDTNQYLVATKVNTPEIQQTFLLSKIKAAESLYEECDFRNTPSLYEYIDANPSGFILKPPQIVTLQVRWAAARTLLNNKLSSDQVNTPIDDAWTEVQATTAITYDLIGWICHHAQSVKVIEPTFLRQQVVTRLRDGLALNIE